MDGTGHAGLERQRQLQRRDEVEAGTLIAASKGAIPGGTA